MDGVETFVNAFQGASTYAIREGLINMGIADNTLVVFSDLMDSILPPGEGTWQPPGVVEAK